MCTRQQGTSPGLLALTQARPWMQRKPTSADTQAHPGWFAGRRRQPVIPPLGGKPRSLPSPRGAGSSQHSGTRPAISVGARTAKPSGAASGLGKSGTDVVTPATPGGVNDYSGASPTNCVASMGADVSQAAVIPPATSAGAGTLPSPVANHAAAAAEASGTAGAPEEVASNIEEFEEATRHGADAGYAIAPPRPPARSCCRVATMWSWLGSALHLHLVRLSVAFRLC